MATVAICVKFINACSRDRRLFRNTLLLFAQDGPLRIAVDSKRTAIKHYYDLAKDSEDITYWLTLLQNRGDEEVFDCLSLELRSGDISMFCEIADAIMVNPSLLCDSVGDHATSIRRGGYKFRFVDRAEAASYLKQLITEKEFPAHAPVHVAISGKGNVVSVGNDNTTTR